MRAGGAETERLLDSLVGGGGESGRCRPSLPSASGPSAPSSCQDSSVASRFAHATLGPLSCQIRAAVVRGSARWPPLHSGSARSRTSVSPKKTCASYWCARGSGVDVVRGGCASRRIRRDVMELEERRSRHWPVRPTNAQRSSSRCHTARLTAAGM